MTISFDPAKRDLVLKRRGLDFADAVNLFAGLHATAVDDRKDYGEVRYISAGLLANRMVVVVWTPREKTRHIISMRYCHAKEAKRWQQAIESLARSR
jgi:uncharacterized DUF497 family protein